MRLTSELYQVERFKLSAGVQAFGIHRDTVRAQLAQSAQERTQLVTGIRISRDGQMRLLPEHLPDEPTQHPPRTHLDKNAGTVFMHVFELLLEAHRFDQLLRQAVPVQYRVIVRIGCRCDIAINRNPG